MAGNRGSYADGPLPYHGGDPNRDLATVLAAVDRIFTDLYGGQNVVLSGFALSVVSGMQVQVGAGVCYANGIFAVTSQQTVNINTTSTNPRYTLLRVTVTPNNPNGTDGTTGNNLIADTAVVDAYDGTAQSSPAKPTLASAYQVQVGSILLPANTSALNASMLNTLDCAPNALYDPSPLTNGNTHRAASLLTATVHGVEASAPGGYGAGNANKLSLLDSNGRGGDTNLFAGLPPSSYQAAGNYDAAGAASAVQTNLNGHTGATLGSAAGVHGRSMDAGTYTTTGSESQVNGYYVCSVTFDYTFSAPPRVYITGVWGAPAPGAGVTGFTYSKSTTGCVVRLNAVGNGIAFDWLAVL